MTTALPVSAYPPDMRRPALAITYAYIEGFVTRHGYRPTIFEIAQGRGLSYQAARRQLEIMQYWGWIYRDGCKRGIELRGIS